MKATSATLIKVGAPCILVGTLVAYLVFSKPPALTVNPLKKTFEDMKRDYSSSSSHTQRHTDSQGTNFLSEQTVEIDKSAPDVLDQIPADLQKDKSGSGSWNCTFNTTPVSYIVDCVDNKQTPILHHVWSAEVHHTNLTITAKVHPDGSDYTEIDWKSETKMINRLKRFYLEHIAHP